MEEEKMNFEHGSCTDSVFSGFGSSSGLNTPAGSDLDSLESEEDDFMAELTRKMAENMLLEDDNKTSPASPVSDNPAKCYKYQHQKKAQFQHQARNRDYGYTHARRPSFLSAAQAGSGMRVVFLGSKNGSSGTGVFLPSQASNNNNNNVNPAYDHQYRRKPVCSTVLVPERVLQTLKQHFDKRSNGHGGMPQSQTQQNQRLQSHENNNQELQLPQEWTY